jgi:DNA-directed RNA polymerase subunit RPC12/RpoP
MAGAIYSCSECGAKMRSPKSLAPGMRLKCPKCGGFFTVPEKEPDDDAYAAEEHLPPSRRDPVYRERDEIRRAPIEKSDTKTVLIILGVVGAAFVVLVIGLVVVWALWPRPSSTEPPVANRQEFGRADPQVGAAKGGAPQGGGVKPKWTLDLAEMKIPDAKVFGSIHGLDFALDKVEFRGGTLTLRQGQDFFPDAAVLIFLFLQPGQTVEGKSYRIALEGHVGDPHVHVQWRDKGEKVPSSAAFLPDKYAMILEFGQAKDGTIPAKIYLCLVDQPKSCVAGTFDVPQNAP